MRLWVCSILWVVIASGCAAPSGNPSQADWLAEAVAGDGPGRYAPATDLQPLEVRNLPKSARGNPSDYTVAGVRYLVMDTAAGYAEHGKASWYGRKFHGRETSSGEVYDMYQLTAAHKHLPLPTFVRVTRTDTGQSIVVKVNDRGPFVAGRIIDLSYQAAYLLGIVNAGTAPVLVEAISSHNDTYAGSDTPGVTADDAATPQVELLAAARAEPHNVPTTTEANFLQLGAFSKALNAQNFASEVGASIPMPIVINYDTNRSLFQVWLGPVETHADRDAAAAALRNVGISTFTMVTSNF